MLELLSPAGSSDALHAAVCNGADAVYLGVDSFNARRGARNFTLDELPEVVRYCHVRGVAVHLTLSTLVTDREMPSAAEYIAAAARAGVDAFIVQDLGIVSLCRQIAPKVALHASTQMSLHSLEGVREAAALSGYEEKSFCRSFREVTGRTFHRYLNETRVAAAKRLLSEDAVFGSARTVAAIGEAVGFPEPKTFSRVFLAVTGKTPAAYRASSVSEKD